jgi:hypothetical protein
MAHVDWYVEGPSFGNCNCKYACPCQFEDLPSHGFCEGFEVLQIDKGHFGDIDLSGLRTALVYRWPGPVFEGGGEMQIIIDERANKAQSDALRRVLCGEETDEAATHWWVYHAMCDQVHEPLTAAIDFEYNIDGRTAKVDVRGLLQSTGRPIRAPHGGGAHRVRIDIPGGIEFTMAEVGSASTSSTNAIALNLNDSYGQWAVIRHGPSGVAA